MKLGMTKLTNTKLKWIIRQNKKRVSTKIIAESMNVSERRIQQIIKIFRLTKVMPTIIKSRRPKTFISDDIKEEVKSKQSIYKKEKTRMYHWRVLEVY